MTTSLERRNVEPASGAGLRQWVTPDRFAAFLAFLVPICAALQPRGMAAVMIIGGVLSGLLIRLHSGRWPQPARDIVLPVAAFLTLGLFSALWGVGPGNTLRQAIELLYTAIPAIAFIALLSDAEPQIARRVHKAFLIGFVIASMITLINVVSGMPIHHLIRGKLDASGENLTPLNRNMLVLASLLWPAALLIGQRWGRIWIFAAALAWAVLIALGESQSALLGIAAGLIVYAAASLWLKATRRILCGVILAALLGAVPLGLLIYKSGLADAHWLPFSMRHRVEIWHFTAQKIMESPLLGWGLDAGRMMNAPPTEHLAVKMSLLPMHPHNAFLQIWLDLGALGAALVFALMLAIMARFRRGIVAADQPVVLAGFASLSASAGVSYGIWQVWWLSVVVLTITLLFSLARRPDASAGLQQRP